MKKRIKKIYIGDKRLKRKDRGLPSSFLLQLSPFNFHPLSIKKLAFSLFFFLSIQLAFAQNISINADGSAPDGSAMLDVVATDKGVLIPRMTQAQRTGIANPATSLIVYQTDGDAGFYFNAGIPSTPSWVKLASENDIGEPVAIQDTDGDTKLDVEGSGDDDQISIEVAGTEYFRIDTVNNGGNSPTPRLQFLNNGSNILIGGNAGSSISNTGGNGVRNVIIGENSGNGTTDYSNVFIGVDVATTNGSAQNVAIGNQAARLGLNRSVAIGHDAGQNGGLDFSVAIGFNAAPSVTDANQSVMIGNNTGANLTSGDHNTLVGANAGSALTIGSGNIFLGKDAGANQTGDNKLFIENSNVSTHLIYGDFTEDSLVINGVLSLDSARDGSGYTLPGSRGSNGQVLTSDGSGRVNWVNVASGNTLDAAYDQGGSGSGRVITADNGALRVAGTDGLMVTGTFGSGSTVGVSGSGQRLFFNPRTGSFRAGTVTGTHWDNSNLGANSVALGYNTTASGTASTAIGSTNNASASNSMVLGYNSNASSTQAMAIGSNVNASGLSAIAMGSGSTASGNYSNTLGFGVLSRSQGEVALGVNNTDYTPNSTSSFNSNDRLLVVGNGSSSSNRSDAFTIYKSGKTYINNTLTLSNGTDSITFPNTDGNPNEVLQTDGSGNISWADAGDDLGSHSASQRIQLNGNKISNDGDNEGLSIWNDGRIVGTPADTVAGNIAFLAKGDFQTAKQGMGYYFSGTQIGITGNNSNSGDMRFRTAATNRMIITSGGQVGVNTTSIPTGYIMHINGLTRINNLNINNNYTLPTVDGDADYVLQTDGSGNVSWAEIIATSADTARVLADVDGNTKIQVEESTNEDLIRFDVAGTEVMRIDDFSRINVPNTRASLFIGNQAGANINAGTNNSFIGYEAGENNSNGSNNTYVGYQAGKAAGFDSRNTFIGSSSGLANNGGIDNTFLGSNTGSSNTTGDRNTFIGQSSGQSNNGDDNIFIGYNAGALQTAANDLLFIENSNSNTPLIYGNFATDSLIFNAATKISSNTSGDAQLVLEADTDDNDSDDNPYIRFFQDGGTTEGFIGLHGSSNQLFANTPSNSMLIGMVSDEDITLFTDNTPRMTIEGGGSVGIGTTEPGYDLHIVDETGNGSLQIESEDAGSDAYINFVTTKSEFQLINYGADSKFYIYSDNSGTDALVVDTLGRVGINMTDPSAAFEVQGRSIADTLEVDGEYTFPAEDGNPLDVLQTDGNGNVSWAAVSGTDNLGNHTATTNINLNGNFLSGDGTAEGIHVDADGDVSIGHSGGFDDFSVWNTSTDLDVGFLSDAGQVEIGFNSYGSGSTSGTELTFSKAAGSRLSRSAPGLNDNVVKFKSSISDGPSNAYVNDFLSLDIDGTVSSPGIIPTRLSFYTGDNTGSNNLAMRIKNTGDVAIGATIPTSKLTVGSNSDETIGITIWSESQTSGFTNSSQLLFRHGSVNRAAIVTEQISTASNGYNLKFQTTNSFGSAMVDHMLIEGATGNVGIGTSSPDYMLDVQGDIRGYNSLGVYNNAVWDHVKISHTGGLATFDAGGVSDGIAFRTENTSVDYNPTYTEHMRILNNGDVGIGMSNPSSKLDVDGDIEIDANGSVGDDAFYFGDPSTDGSWRIRRDGNDLSFELKESGLWVIKVKMNP